MVSMGLITKACFSWTRGFPQCFATSYIQFSHAWKHYNYVCQEHHFFLNEIGFLSGFFHLQFGNQYTVIQTTFFPCLLLANCHFISICMVKTSGYKLRNYEYRRIWEMWWSVSLLSSELLLPSSLNFFIVSLYWLFQNCLSSTTS